MDNIGGFCRYIVVKFPKNLVVIQPLQATIPGPQDCGQYHRTSFPAPIHHLYKTFGSNH